MNKIAFLNDGLRRTFARGRVVMTQGVASLPEETQTQVLERVRHFDDFNAENDPHGEHDFGSFDIDVTTIFWKIDLYDKDLKFGSSNPEDPSVTTPVLTIFLAEEY